MFACAYVSPRAYEGPFELKLRSSAGEKCVAPFENSPCFHIGSEAIHRSSGHYLLITEVAPESSVLPTGDKKILTCRPPTEAKYPSSAEARKIPSSHGGDCDKLKC